MRKLKTHLSQSYANIDSWLLHMHQRYPHIQIEKLTQAIKLAELSGKDIKTPNGQTCLQQSFGMVDILVDLNVDTDTLMAAIVYGNVQYAELGLREVEETLSPVVMNIVQGVRKMDALQDLHKSISGKAQLDATIDNFRKMLLAMVDDIRVVLVKLAEQLYVLHHLEHFSEEERYRIASISMDIYASLANRLGIGHLKWQIEDMAFRYIKPEAYKAISKSLNHRRVEREEYINEMISLLRALMKKAGLEKVDVMGRAKHIYSIYRKMQRKQVDIEEIYDTMALRILVPTLEDCYAALGCVHASWEPIPKEFDDYIAHPKPNGYRSIHTAVIGPNHRHVEIQIRTEAMHEESELGVAAHWAYKEGRAKRTGYEDKIAWLRQVMDWQKEVAQTDVKSQEIQVRVFDERVYVFTPNGDVIDLPQGSTPLDFAYHIHSNIGHHCRGAKIGGILVPITYQLKTGDRVEILTANNIHPSRDWLNPTLGYLKTARARAKVATWFRQQDYEHDLARGKEAVEKEIKRLHLKNVDQQEMAQKLKHKTVDDFWAAIGRGDIRIQSVIHILQGLLEIKKEEEPQDEISFEKTSLKTDKSSTGIVIEGVGGLLTTIAQCCKPVPNEPIVGYVTVGRGVSIHRADCVNLLNSIDTRRERLINVNWGERVDGKYSVDLLVIAYDRQGLMRDITHMLASEAVNITQLNSVADKVNSVAHIKVTIEIEGLEILSRVIAKINQIPSVFEVKRAE